jgi:hypothetical protein
MRVHQLREVLGEARKFIVDFQLHARREETEPFEQTFHVGIRAFEAFQSEPPGDLRKLAGELATHLP